MCVGVEEQRLTVQDVYFSDPEEMEDGYYDESRQAHEAEAVDVAPQRPRQPSENHIWIHLDTMHKHIKHHVKKHHRLVWFLGSVLALVLLLRWQGPALRSDWTPLGLGIKAILCMLLIVLLYYPYEMFVKGPTAVRRSLRTRR